jgi:secreted PhoX family phosphatase
MSGKKVEAEAKQFDDAENYSSNPSKNRPFVDVLQTVMSRRKVMVGGLSAAAVGFLAPSALVAKPKNGDFSANYLNPKGKSAGTPLIDFEPVTLEQAEASDGKTPLCSEDYTYHTLIPWGTALFSGVTDYTGDPINRPSADDQAKMIGIGHDGMWLFPEKARGRQSNRSGTLCINHEFGINTHVLPEDLWEEVDRGSRDRDGEVIFEQIPTSLEAVQRSQHAHGVSVVAIEKPLGSDEWTHVVDAPQNRRIHVNTPVEFSGPVSIESELLDTGVPPLGTVNNCSSGYTPWGTYLTCEENFNGYFGDGTASLVGTDWIGEWSPTEEQERYGISSRGFDYGWEQHDPRFDLSQEKSLQETNRFGWVVEIDPNDPMQNPVKRTALGRFKHEGAEVTVGKGGRVVVYMGDDQRFDYIYKYVSADNWKSMRARGMSPLDEGHLYVARFDDDNTGEWLELTIDNPVLADRFDRQEEVLTYARVAADLLEATPMDRPEWISVAPDDYVYCTLTNNSRRTVADAANPLAPNPDGHIIRWKDSENYTGTSFEWDIYVIAETTHGTEESFSDPDGLWADPDGRLFIETDGGQPEEGLQNQILVSDTSTGEIRRLLTGVNSDEITGLTVTPDRRTLFCNTQHPGNGDPSRTNFPAPTDDVTIPRDCTFVLTRKDGGIVGS